MSTPKAKRGYRPLGIGEVVQAGDLCWFASRWQPVTDFKDQIGKAIGNLSYRHCRPVVREGAKLLRMHSVKPAAPARTAEQVEMAFAACRSIKFAAEDAERRGTWDLNSLVAANRLALVALGVVATLEDAP